MSPPKPHLLLLDPDRYSIEARELLGTVADVVDGPLTRQELCERIGEFDVLVLRLSHRIDADLIGRAGRLKAVATNTTGLDHIDLVAARQHGIAVLSLRGELAFLETIVSTAELTWGLLLSLIRQIPAAHRSVLDGAWRRDDFVGRDLAGRTLGVVGCGRIGRKVAAYGAAFGMSVLAFDPDPRVIPSTVVACASLHELLGRSEVVTLHVTEGADTRGLIGTAELGLMRPGALLVNTSRGSVVDSEALLAALDSGQLAGAALDVVDGELAAGFPGHNRLIDFARRSRALVITPHIGGVSSDSWARTETFLAKKIVDFFAAPSLPSPATAGEGREGAADSGRSTGESKANR